MEFCEERGREAGRPRLNPPLEGCLWQHLTGQEEGRGQRERKKELGKRKENRGKRDALRGWRTDDGRRITDNRGRKSEIQGQIERRLEG